MSLKNGLRILDLLASQGEGVGLVAIADALSLPRSTCHRLLAELVESGYVRQLTDHSRYILTMRMTSNGLEFLSLTGISDIAQPIIERVAAQTGELARLSLVDGEAIIWVGKADGHRIGFRYDPDMGQAARLSCTSTGHAWLMTMTDEQAIALVLKQGFGPPNEFGPNAPTTLKALLGIPARCSHTWLRDNRRGVCPAHVSDGGACGKRFALRRRYQFGRSAGASDCREDSRVLGTAARGSE